jgi:predicted HicB family RNase H-like nuclease
MSGGDDDEKVTIGAKVSPTFKRRVRIAAAKQGQSMSAYIRDAVATRLADDEGREEAG